MVLGEGMKFGGQEPDKSREAICIDDLAWTGCHDVMPAPDVVVVVTRCAVQCSWHAGLLQGSWWDHHDTNINLSCAVLCCAAVCCVLCCAEVIASRARCKAVIVNMCCTCVLHWCGFDVVLCCAVQGSWQAGLLGAGEPLGICTLNTADCGKLGKQCCREDVPETGSVKICESTQRPGSHFCTADNICSKCPEVPTTKEQKEECWVLGQQMESSNAFSARGGGRVVGSRG